LFLSIAGFAILPFLWAINTVWFFNDAFRKPLFEEQAEMRKCNPHFIHYAIPFLRHILLPDVIRSGVGALIWTGIFIAWTCVFQINRAAWGEVGDQLSFVIPRGIA
jgi:presenilin enhancer 2